MSPTDRAFASPPDVAGQPLRSSLDLPLGPLLAHGERQPMKVALGNDHAGYPLKRDVSDFLESLGHDVLDRGAPDAEPVDFPDIVWATCAEIRRGHADRAVLVCGTGVGAVMAANKIAGIRCALAHDVYSAHQSVEHDDANVIALGSWIVGRAIACEAIAAFLAATFDADEDTLRRVRKLRDLELRSARELDH